MATLATRLSDLATRIATKCKSLNMMINGNVSDLTGLHTVAKSSLMAAINELKDDLDEFAAGSGALINDASNTSTTETWSAVKTYTAIADAMSATISSLVNGAPGALNTLNELATALGNDASFATTITNGLAARVRFDAAQTLSSGEKIQGNANLGSLSLAQSGDPDTNLVNIFDAALV